MHRKLINSIAFYLILFSTALGAQIIISPAPGGGSFTSICSGSSNGQVLFNDSDACAGDSAFTWDKTTNSLTLLDNSVETSLNLIAAGGFNSAVVYKASEGTVVTPEPSFNGDGLGAIQFFGYAQNSAFYRSALIYASVGDAPGATTVPGQISISVKDASDISHNWLFGSDGSFRIDDGGIKLSVANGSLTFLGLGDGTDEDLTLNLNSANVGTFSSSTGLTSLAFTSIGLAPTSVTSNYSTTSNCSDSAGDAACGSASAGSVVVDAADTTTVVSTTSVTANSQIIITDDVSLGSRLSVTCNTTVPTDLRVTARSTGTSFTITTTAPVTNPLCVNFLIIN